MAKRFKLTDDSVNSYGFRILTAGIDLSLFLKNPIMLYDHDDYRRLPIGKWENITVEPDGLYADAVFDLKDPFAAEVARKVEEGVLNMTSIGARSIEESDDPLFMLPGQRYSTVTKSRLREASIVPVGSNFNSIAMYDDAGKRIELNDKSLSELFQKPTKKNNMKKVNVLLKLSDTASEDEQEQAVQALITRAETAERKLADRETADKAARKMQAETLVTAAITEQRIDAKLKDHYLSLFDKDFVAAQEILAGVPKRVTAKDVVANNGGGGEDPLLKMSFDELDRQGRLAELKKKYPDAYKQKHDEAFPPEA